MRKTARNAALYGIIFYDEEEMINEYDLTVFVQEEGDLFRRYCETHYQRAYSLETVRVLIEKQV